MVFVASIEISLRSAADRSRFLVLELLRPSARKDPVTLTSDEVEVLRDDLYALALKVAIPARELARKLAATVKVEGVDGRLIEGYAVPVAFLACATEMSEAEAARSLKEYLVHAVLPNDSGEVIEDEAALLRDLAFSKVRVTRAVPNGNHERTESIEMSVAQILNVGDHELLQQLEAKGVMRLADDRVFLVPTQIERHLLTDTRWAGLSLREILLRVPGATNEHKHRIAGSAPQRGVEVSLDSLCAFEVGRAGGTEERWHAQDNTTA